jgi:hypothetical protein
VVKGHNELDRDDPLAAIGGGGFARGSDGVLSIPLLAGGAETVVEVPVTTGEAAVVGVGEQPVAIRPPMDSPIIVMRIAPE